ncbi:MAG: hypothetical protein COA36_06910 [Desulfotalea sp.]|nr:MAG: hypothetical protein COA36_06910 [Desulfotalea sp.]
MTEFNSNNKSSPSRSRVKKGTNRLLYFIIFVTILALTSGFYFYQKLMRPQSAPKPEFTAEATATTIATGSTPSSGLAVTSIIPDPTIDLATAVDPQILPPLPPQEVPETTLERLEIPAKVPGSNVEVEAAKFSRLITTLNSFYSHLDSQQYMQDFKLSESSKVHFSKLIQKLIDNPPVVTRETDDLFTLLKNTAHFFRVIGKDNILIIKGILDREKGSFETILQTFYNLTDNPEYLKEAYSVSLDPSAIYDYAGFFLNTMGGRLYLFRRDSKSRMVVSYYAILIIDRANRAGHSPHGIDIRPAVDSLIEEIENGGNNLKLREAYLDSLYDLKEKYN